MHWFRPGRQQVLFFLFVAMGAAGVILFWAQVIPMWVAGLMLIPIGLMLFGGPKETGSR